MRSADDNTTLSVRTPFRMSPFVVLFYGCVTILVIAAMTLPHSRDYVGSDNDDVMRLVEVRDFLTGQGWFDLMQYRLGLEPGTLMHWSRLIDLPIAALIRLFGLWLPPLKAEAMALTVWPLMTTLPVLAIMGSTGARLGGRAAMHIALGLTALYLITSNKFLPGAIDHDNVQVPLMAFLALALSSGEGWRIYAWAGFAAALALAIGAETTPIVAVACAIVALQWGWSGVAMRGRVLGFSLSLALCVTGFFVATVPPARYGVVTCDNLSFGFYSLSAMGGGLLFALALFASRSLRIIRLALLSALAATIFITAHEIAPQCLGNPLANLDPMLVTLWLDHINEARSFLMVAKTSPDELGGYYAVGLLAILVSAIRLLRRDRPIAHLTYLLLVGVSYAITVIQVRGSTFSNLLAIPPLALLAADLRHAITHQKRSSPSYNLAYALTLLASVPALWSVCSVLLIDGPSSVAERLPSDKTLPTGSHGKTARHGCDTQADLQELADLPATTVSAPSGLGTAILRFTHHRVLAAPYHRDQAGLLTQLHIGLATPKDAHAFLAGAKVGILAFCANDLETKLLMRTKPDGLYAMLDKGDVPDFLTPLPPSPQSGLILYRVQPETEKP
ncbi:hypothetical protein NAC44_05155 [Allorhizobium sp. BGMRC 0089]|uniref:hypothetical protein n=1 Tax=Allorhizobium sonneratiae TaxID=2934936 RepID=UPI0020346205|nr:hypothetical protein [Allorhizobium sonneratiae]MCM2291715.1 hypothetical protein [Allorhizobium sonneratiae]